MKILTEELETTREELLTMHEATLELADELANTTRKLQNMNRDQYEQTARSTLLHENKAGCDLTSSETIRASAVCIRLQAQRARQQSEPLVNKTEQLYLRAREIIALFEQTCSLPGGKAPLC